MSLLAASVPNINPDFFKRLDKVFPHQMPEPNKTTVDDIMYNAGQRSVIEWIRLHMTRSVVTGQVE